MNPGNRVLLFPLLVISTILVGWLLRVGAPIVQPLVIALLLASMLSPVVRVLERFRIPPIASVLGVVTLLFFGLFQLAVVAQENIETFLRDTTAETAGRRLEPLPPSGESKAELNSTATSPVDPIGTELQGSQPASPAELDLASSTFESTESSEPAPEEPDSGTDSRGEPTSEGAGGEDSSNPRGVLGSIQETQTEAIEQAGGLGALLDKLSARVQRSALPAPVIDYLSEELNDLKTDGRLGRLASAVLGGGLAFTRVLLLVVIYMLFIFAEQAVFRRKILAVAGERREEAARVLDTIGRGIQQFLGIKTLISIATAALCYTVLVVLNIPYALLFGFLTFGLNFIPYFGSLMAGFLPTLTALAIEPTLEKAIIVAMTYMMVNVFLGSFVEPKILGRELDLSPLVIIVSVVIWGSLWGVVGAFLAVPLTATLQIVMASSEHTRPIAILLSSGPPRDSRRRLRRLATE